MKALYCFLICISVIFFSCKKKESVINDVKEPPVIIKPPENPPNIPTALVYLKNDGTLGYNFFANQGEEHKVNVIPDFSMAGYQGGGVAIPVVAEIKKTLSPLSGDNLSQIQAAITEVESLSLNASGIRGVILLLSGTYNVSNTINITKSGVILRGEGQGASGTILKATRTAQHTLISIKGIETLPTLQLKKITTEYVATGRKGFKIESNAGIIAGDKIVVYRTPNQLWIADLDMAQYGWTASSYAIGFERKVVAVIGDSISLNAPIVDPMQKKYGGGSIYKINPTQRINNCGIENMRLTSVFSGDEDENHGWVGVELEQAENCWVRKVTSEYFGYAGISISSGSFFNTIEECAMLNPKSITTGGRKYSFNLEGAASFNLFQRCYTKGGRHDFVTGSRVPGPNVFLDCLAIETTADIGPHHRWSTGLLFDNISGGQIRVQDRGDSGSGHGWAGGQTMFYNCKSYKSDIKVESPKGSLNWGIGCIGTSQLGNGYWENWGQNVTPRSLYLAQLKDRLGMQAVNNVTTRAQRLGSMEALLRGWAGEGKLSEE
ncbi:hypothetical protein AAKU52_001869 [Pedobacter sp. CG_S7]|uniref:hypothetical protein n=1 Tax=Pedobacter sp. CG_S7 TaxID=3143930 RepID=UPI0033991E90